MVDKTLQKKVLPFLASAKKQIDCVEKNPRKIEHLLLAILELENAQKIVECEKPKVVCSEDICQYYIPQ